jgi:hypothetical protein
MTTRPLLHTLACALSFLLVSCTKPDKNSNADQWQSDLSGELPRLGHRNFIVIADSAYPLQSARVAAVRDSPAGRSRRCGRGCCGCSSGR